MQFSFSAFYYKIFRRFRENTRCFKNFFLHLSRKPYTFFLILHKMFLLSYCLMVWWCLQMKIRVLANVSKKKTQWTIQSNLLYFIHNWNISNITSLKNSLKFNLFIFKFGFDWVHEKMLNDTNLKIIRTKYVRDTKWHS